MRDSLEDKLFYSFNYVFLSLSGLLCLLPLLHILALSLSDPQALLAGAVGLWPVNFTFTSYDLLMQGTNVIRAFGNSVIITVIGVILSMGFTIMAAYPLSRKLFYARRFFTLAILFTMLFHGGLIPTYLVMNGLGLVNSYWALWWIGLISVFNMLVMRTFFQNIPVEMEEAAYMDGCGEWRLLCSIIVPLSVPVMAALLLFYGVSYWNQFLHVLIYIHDSNKLNLTVLVQQMIQSATLATELELIQPEDSGSIAPQGVKSAGIIVMIIPMLVVYPFLQQYFVKGIMLGSVKG